MTVVAACVVGQRHQSLARQQQRYDNDQVASSAKYPCEPYASNTQDIRAGYIGRVAETQEAGDVITFLASDMASYLTGVAINIDGGTSPVV